MVGMQAAAIQAFVPLDDPGTTAGRQERTKGLDAVVTLLKTLKVGWLSSLPP